MAHFGLKIAFFTTSIVAMSFPMAYLRLKSGSLWTGAIFHASHNLFLQSIFTPLTQTNDASWRFVDETGMALPGALIIVAIYFYRKGKKEFG